MAVETKKGNQYAQLVAQDPTTIVVRMCLSCYNRLIKHGGQALIMYPINRIFLESETTSPHFMGITEHGQSNSNC